MHLCSTVSASRNGANFWPSAVKLAMVEVTPCEGLQLIFFCRSLQLQMFMAFLHIEYSTVLIFCRPTWEHARFLRSKWDQHAETASVLSLAHFKTSIKSVKRYFLISHWSCGHSRSHGTKDLNKRVNGIHFCFPSSLMFKRERTHFGTPRGAVLSPIA